MKFVKSAAIAACGLAMFGLAGVFTGCSDSDSSSDAVAAGSSDVQSFDVASCNSDIDAGSVYALEQNKEGLVEYFKALSDGDLQGAQQKGASVKSSYGNILAGNPANCEAQVGYALASIANIVNNDGLKALIDTLRGNGTIETGDNYSLYKISSEQTAQVVVGSRALAKEASGKSVIVRVQDAIGENLLPVTDSAITYLTNVVRNGNVTILYNGGSRPVELDNGEFAPALGALYLMRALLVGVASVNVDITENGSFRWIETLDSMDISNYKTNPGVKKLLSLMDADNSFGSIKDNWAEAYGAIPNMLDSAITYVQLGLQYGINEAANGLATQMNDVYVVGNDEDADVSVSDLQMVIDSLNFFKNALHGDMEFKLGERSIVVNLGKFFKITNFKKYLPYYKIVDPADWYKDLPGSFWEEGLDGNSFGASELEFMAENNVASTSGPIDNRSAYIVDKKYYFDDEAADGLMVMVYGYLGSYTYADAAYDAVANGCDVTLSLMDYYVPSYYEMKDSLILKKYAYTISPEFCKVEDGVVKFLKTRGSTRPNMFYFTDAKGNKTASVIELDNFDSVEELKQVIIFPDVTFGGVFPKMTTDELWDWVGAFMEDDDYDDDDYYYDYYQSGYDESYGYDYDYDY